MKLKKFFTFFLSILIALPIFCTVVPVYAESAVTDMGLIEGTGGKSIILNFADYCDGVVNGYDTGTSVNAEKTGKKTVKLTPNPTSSQGTVFKVDGYSYKSAGIDLNTYRYAAVEYRYESKNPVKDARIELTFQKTGGIFADGTSGVVIKSDEKLVANKWFTTVFDLSALSGKLVSDTDEVILQQMHLTPFSGLKLSELTTNDIMYVSKIMFFETKPAFENKGMSVAVDFADYCTEVVNSLDTGSFETVYKNGRRSVKLTPNPYSTQGTTFKLDGYAYKSAGIDLTTYRWAAVEYRYESKNPVKDTRIELTIQKTGGVFAENVSSVSAKSKEPITSGKWNTAVFDFTSLDGKVAQGDTVNLQHMHLRPFADISHQELSTDDIMYVARIMFFETEPSIDDTGEIVTVDFSDYEDGIVNARDTGSVEVVLKDGKRVVKVVPNPAATNTVNKNLVIDAYSFESAGIDLNKIRYIAVEYLYESPSPVKNTPINITIYKTGNVFSENIPSVSKNSQDNLVSGEWTTTLFDFSDLEGKINPDNENVNLQQLHFTPFNGKLVTQLTKNDVIYIGRMMFFENKPTFEKHGSYINGYDDGTFRPGGYVSRAEACAMIARIAQAEENINGTAPFSDVGKNEWYAKYIGYCYENGLLEGYGESFYPNRTISRAEFCEMLYLASLKMSFSIPQASNVLSENLSAFTSVSQDALTRAEACVIINNARGTARSQAQLTDDTILLFLDVDTSHWAFSEIAEAAVAHTEHGGKWLFASEDPVTKLCDIVGEEIVYNYAKSYDKIAELDKLEAERIEEIRSTPNMDLSHITGKKIYVSTSGSDSNNGLSASKPVKTAAKANALAASGDAILFKRGDLWREVFTAKSGVTYTAYGNGAKPTFYGSPENGADASKWTLDHRDAKTGALIWKYQNQNFLDIGTLVFNDGEGFAIKEIPSCVGTEFIVRGTTDTPFDYKTELDRNLEFFHAANSATKTLSDGTKVIDPSSAKGPLYLRCDNGNPGLVFDSIEFIRRSPVIAVSTRSNITIDNLRLMYSSFGISAQNQKNLTITNLEIGWIGGNIQTYSYSGSTNGRVTRYGNGIEVYGSCDGYTVNNCYIYECYDAGVTHQMSASEGTKVTQNNVTYSNNVITDCVYSIEYFLGANESNKSYERRGENILFEGNLLRRAGYGFGSIRPDIDNQRHIRSGSSKNDFSNYIIKNNIFDRAVEELCETSTAVIGRDPVYSGNTYIQGVGNGLYRSGTGKEKNTNFAAEKFIKEELGDKTAKVYFVPYIPEYEFTYKPEKTVPIS